MNHRCPDEETLAAYFDGLLEPAEEGALHREMLACTDCTRLVAALGLAIEAEVPGAWQKTQVPAHITQRAMDLFPTIDAEPLLNLAVRWIGERLAPLVDALQPSPLGAVALRGAPALADEARDDLRYQVTLGDVPVEIDLEVDGPEQIAVTIRPLREPPAGLVIRLEANGVTRAMSTLNSDGTTLEALSAGTYQLTLEQSSDVVGEIQLALHADA